MPAKPPPKFQNFPFCLVQVAYDNEFEAESRRQNTHFLILGNYYVNKRSSVTDNYTFSYNLAPF